MKRDPRTPFAYNSDAIEKAAEALKSQPLGSRACISAGSSLVRIYQAPAPQVREVEAIRAEEDEALTIQAYQDPLRYRNY